MDSALFVGPLDRVLLLRTLPMLEGLGPAYAAAIAQHAQERFLERDTVLRTADDAAEAVHLIVEGEVEVEREGGGKRRLRAGDAVGFVEMLSRRQLRREVRATVDTVVLELDWEAQLDVCEEHFPIVMQYIGYLAGRTVEELQRQPVASTGPVDAVASQQFESELNLVERVLVLSRSRTFSAGCLDALAELAHHVTDARCGAGEQIWAIDDFADHFLLLASGSIRCMKRSGEAIEHFAGAAVGMHEALQQGRRWHDAVSQSDIVMLKIEIEPFMDILEDHFDLALDYLASLAGNLIDLQPFETDQEPPGRGA